LYDERAFTHAGFMMLDRGILAAEGEIDTTTDAATRLDELRRAMAACADLEQLRSVLASRLAPLLPVTDRASIVLLEPDGEWLRIYRILPVEDHPRGPLPRMRVDSTPAGQVVRDGVGRVVADVRTDPNITFGHVSHDGIRSTVSVPVKLGTRIVGAMNAGSRTVGACTEAMLRTLAEVAAVVGPAFYAAEQALVVPEPGQAVRVTSRSRGRSNDLVGSCPAFLSMLAAARRTARSDADVLLTGETGVGKTALARALHEWSARRAGPFVTVHLADLTPTLIESELFGYERGAFTGASAGRMGRFESAEGGTILLDEIGETPLATQAKLLRVIQDRCFERVGGGRTIETNVRIIAATNSDLRAAIGRRAFREDLFFRLSVVPLHVPPLRDRVDDLDLLVQAILERIQATDGRVRSLSPAARARVHAYPWPGNIRELESVLHRATILEEADELVLDGLGAPLDAGSRTGAIAATEVPQRWPTLDEHERSYIEQVLQVHNGTVEGARGAASILGVPPSTLRSKMKRLGISAQRAKGQTR
jgi:transcriptional regulator with GAF, ATPase, and Fis domain